MPTKVPITWDGINPLTGQPFTWDDPGLTWDGEIEIPDEPTNMQDLIDLSPITTQDWTDIDAALDVIETKLISRLIDLTPQERKELTKMGDKSEAFARQCLVVARQNDGKLPADTVTELGAAEGDLSSIDKLRPRLTRLMQMVEKADDSEVALGSDIMVFALAVYGILKAIGAGAGLDQLKAQMSARFVRKAKAKPADGGSGGTP